MKLSKDVDVFADNHPREVSLKCSDIELADELDDFFAQHLDQELRFKFEVSCVWIFFGDKVSLAEVVALYEMFEKGRDRAGRSA